MSDNLAERMESQGPKAFYVFETEDPCVRDFTPLGEYAIHVDGAFRDYMFMRGLEIQKRLGNLDGLVGTDVSERKSLAGARRHVRLTVTDPSAWPNVEQVADEVLRTSFPRFFPRQSEAA